ncbi:stage V sporulation protein D (sporulation-specific penicillin-binding protein) [Clostridium acetobutylicum]|uniref:Stage V sporulation protein D, spoVD, FtsI/pbp family n=1 Tax=Clostridium acetobutylicum (strain ATCC 824 / DSM 792 / JCM 1419 / IAM 19013 / LMG 5710 / NBRC 13948 / NRRL B-527 / VKM B-1787 / 2291 / W) TaxID=272562 RepID=Q97H83_CLOAB|nr:MULTISPECIES: stage V sporulation protein D [Clostridium]AAK80088.1 Stage V sporulation protein D, spoVD, FtsI/pbp family [Clostridium acetobutylicum ATCC 824]ADZ21181.1 Stage V sporulation protein D, spoVD, FtsI/pbp family [Clostridium acetobutylicum EA 2018]AEI34662.1 stage V sporulation protein D [Clostridium acetobutylicum DSM 1731]AWV79486.1 stage V sporulation protein D [Clostridium acetobutylicum]MBC2394542.1 stage V sporulation protein D [Clostridium acetobutylicum]
MPKRILVDKATIRNRIFIVFLILTCVIFLLCYKLFNVMVARSSRYKKMAQEQWTSEVKISAKRGRILDRNGEELAISGNVYRVDLDLNTIKNSLAEKKMKMDELADRLSSALDMDKKDVSKQLNKKFKDGRPMGSAILTRRIDKDKANKVLAINVKGVMVSPDTKRYYPNSDFLSQVIGHTNSDGDGLTGVELKYNKYLKGKPGVRKAEIDKNSANLPYTISEYSKPLDGRDVVLTIDKNMQYFAEKYAQEALVNNKAKAVSILIMNPKNGEILAMANKPDYDLNDPWDKSKSYDELQKSWRNRVVSDAFEPGSIFKVITSSAAMSLGIVHENDKFNCGGSITVAKKTIHCWKRTGHGEETFVDILKNSCNVGFAELGERLGAKNLNDYINKFGFGRKTGIDLPGEARGIIRPTNKIGPVDLATIAFGQSNTVSMVQYMQAFNSVANGGYLITPHVMREISHVENNRQVVDKEYSDYNKKRILDESMTATLRGYLEKVVSEGGGKKAFIDGYHIGGKTGTAQKPNPNGGGYEHGKYIASFVGMAPASDPKITVMVSIDEPDPSNYYAGQISAPVGQKVFNDIFNYLGIKPDTSSSDAAKSMLKDVVIPNIRGMKKEDAIKTLKNLNIDADVDGNGEYVSNTTPIPGITVKEGTKVVLYTGDSPNYNNNDVIVPNLTGYSKKEAEETLKSLGLDFKISGDGVVESQSIDAGKQVNKGTVLTLKLEENMSE